MCIFSSPAWTCLYCHLSFTGHRYYTNHTNMCKTHPGRSARPGAEPRRASSKPTKDLTGEDSRNDEKTGVMTRSQTKVMKGSQIGVMKISVKGLIKRPRKEVNVEEIPRCETQNIKEEKIDEEECDPLDVGKGKENCLKCRQCNYVGPNKRSLARHTRTHNVHECPECVYKTNDTGNLKKHLLVHTGELPFKCSVCGNLFRQSSHLHRHMRTHTGEKPYQCQECGWRFRNTGAIRGHMLIHEGRKPIQCPHCPYRCRQSNGLNCHLRVHHKEKFFQCPVCDYRCWQGSTLNRHVLAKH